VRRVATEPKQQHDCGIYDLLHL